MFITLPWLVLSGALIVILILVLVRIGSTPKELMGQEFMSNVRGTFTLPSPHPKRLSLWGRYELDSDDNEAIVTVLYKITCEGNVIADGASNRGRVRVWHEGTENHEVFSELIATLPLTSPNKSLEVEATIRSADPAVHILTARLFITT